MCGGELSGLFVTERGYNSDGSGLNTSDDTAGQIANRALFSNLQSSSCWSGSKNASDVGLAWAFRANVGIQGGLSKPGSWYAVAVRPGDVATAVPEPQTLALALLALARRRWRASGGHVEALTRRAL